MLVAAVLAVLAAGTAQAQTPDAVPDTPPDDVSIGEVQIGDEPPLREPTHVLEGTAELGPHSPDQAPDQADGAEADAAAQDATPPSVTSLEGPILPVSHIEVIYDVGERGLPPADTVLPIEVELVRTEDGGLAPARDGETGETVSFGGSGGTALPLHASAIGAVSQALLDGYRDIGLLGVYVEPSRDDIEFTTETDLRPAGDTGLRMIISVGRVREVRTVASGRRIASEWRINNQLHRRIRRDSPLQPTGVVVDGTTDLLNKDLLEDYLFLLNRHPGRRVDASVAASQDGQGAALDYLIHEAKPWHAYFQAANTGTANTGTWQQRMGATHYQLTNRDDILGVEYLTASFKDLHAVRAYYEAPWFGGKRPGWAKSKPHETGWVSWIPRDKIPWWGAERIRWRLEGGWGKYTASDVGRVRERFTGEDWSVGGSLLWNVFQHKALFIDVIGGLRFRNVSVKRRTLATDNDGLFMLPSASVRIERKTDTSYLRLIAGIEGSASSILGTTNADASLLGRLDAESDWAILRWNGQMSQFLEPLLNRRRWEDPSTPWSSTLAHELYLSTRGQYAFDYRLIPQAEQVAGGLFSVRGYPQSIAVGDSVYMGTAEYRFHLGRAIPLYSKPIQLPWIGDFRLTPQQTYGSADWDLIFRAFVDTAYTAQNGTKNAAGVAITGEGTSFLLGAGVGAELRLRRNITARVDWGMALSEVDRGPGRVVEVGNTELNFVFSILY